MKIRFVMPHDMSSLDDHASFFELQVRNLLIFSSNYMHSSVWNCVVRQHIERHSIATVISFSMLTVCNCEIAQYWDAKNIKTVRAHDLRLTGIFTAFGGLRLPNTGNQTADEGPSRLKFAGIPMAF